MESPFPRGPNWQTARRERPAQTSNIGQVGRSRKGLDAIEKAADFDGKGLKSWDMDDTGQRRCQQRSNSFAAIPGRGRSIRMSPMPEVPDAIPDPPVFLVGYAADEWRHVAIELYRMRLLSTVDTAALAAYCQAYKIWRETTEMMTEIAARGAFMKGYLLKRKGEAIKNPLNAIAGRAAQDMVRYSAEFGFTPSSRSRVAVGSFGQTQKPGKFDGLLGE
jgi:P27 family predicted phage terminase small subunit